MSKSPLEIAREALVAARRAIRQIKRTTNEFDEAREICDKAEQQATDALAEIAALSQPVADGREAWYRLVISLGCMFDFETSGSIDEVAASARAACDSRASQPVIKESLNTQAVEPVADEEVYNPWREPLENCINGDNYLRASEYRELIEELDELYRLRAAPVPQEAVQQDWNAAIEAAAQVCDELVWALDHGGNKYRHPADAEKCAAAVRALLKSQKGGGN